MRKPFERKSQRSLALVAAATLGMTVLAMPAFAQPVHHLYVSDSQAGTILRYPMSGAIPASRPDAAIGGLRDPRGIAIAPDGSLYVVDRGTRQLLIYAPMPGTGARPLRTVPIGHAHGLGDVTVDPNGYVYVAWTAVCTTEGFSCGYATVYSPLARGLRPIRTLAFGGGGGGSATALVTAMAVDPTRNMIVTAGGNTPVIYSNAPQLRTAYYTFCGAVAPAGSAWGGGRTIFETDLGGIQPKTPAQIVVVPDYTKGNVNNCPSFYTITSATYALRDPLSIAAYGHMIYVTGGYDARAGSALVFVFNPAVAGRQRPVAVIGGAASMLRTPQSLAIGP